MTTAQQLRDEAEAARTSRDFKLAGKIYHRAAKMYPRDDEFASLNINYLLNMSGDCFRTARSLRRW